VSDAESTDALHALVCNAFGYDKSIVRALALWARGETDNLQLRALCARVLEAEERARMASRCEDVHPLT